MGLELVTRNRHGEAVSVLFLGTYSRCAEWACALQEAQRGLPATAFKHFDAEDLAGLYDCAACGLLAKDFVHFEEDLKTQEVFERFSEEDLEEWFAIYLLLKTAFSNGARGGSVELRGEGV